MRSGFGQACALTGEGEPLDYELAGNSFGFHVKVMAKCLPGQDAYIGILFEHAAKLPWEALNNQDGSSALQLQAPIAK